MGEATWDADATVDAARRKLQESLLVETEIGLDQQGRLTVDRGSTRAFLEFIPRADRQLVYVTITAPVAFYVPLSPDLYEYVARKADQWYFGHLAMSPYPLESEHSNMAFVYVADAFVAEFAQPQDVVLRTFGVINAADSIDEDFTQKFGGTRYADS